MTDRCDMTDLLGDACAHCRGDADSDLPAGDPRRFQATATGILRWPVKNIARHVAGPITAEAPTDDPRIQASRDLRAIRDMAAMLGDRAEDLADDPDMIGGEAMVNLAGVGNLEAWGWQEDTDARQALAGLRARAYTSTDDEDPDESWSPAQILEFWSEDWRREFDHEHPGRPTITSEAAFLADRLGWASKYEPRWDDFCADMGRARARLENIVRDGIRETRSRVLCDRCNEPKRLIRKWGKGDRGDEWKAPCCKAIYTEDEAKRTLARQLRSRGAERWVKKPDAISAIRVQGWSERQVTEWLADERDPIETMCDTKGRGVHVWWPSLWRRHLIATQDRAVRVRRTAERKAKRDACAASHGPECWHRGRCTNRRSA